MVRLDRLAIPPEVKVVEFNIKSVPEVPTVPCMISVPFPSLIWK